MPKAAADIAAREDFEIRAFKMKAAQPEEKRPARLVRVAAVQHPIYRKTTDSIVAQYKALEEKVGHIVDAAAALGVNVLGLQEAWTCPFFFCTREKHPWLEFAEVRRESEGEIAGGLTLCGCVYGVGRWGFRLHTPSFDSLSPSSSRSLLRAVRGERRVGQVPAGQGEAA